MPEPTLREQIQDLVRNAHGCPDELKLKSCQDCKYHHPEIGCMFSEAAEDVVAKVDKLEQENSLLRLGISEALAAPTLEQARIPLVGCTLKRMPVTEEDMKWAQEQLKEKEHG